MAIQAVDKLGRAVRIRVFGGLENSKPHWTTDDLWIEGDGDQRDTYGRIETEFKRLNADSMIINVEDRTWLVTLKEIVLEPEPAATPGQTVIGDFV